MEHPRSLAELLFSWGDGEFRLRGTRQHRPVDFERWLDGKRDTPFLLPKMRQGNRLHLTEIF
jgi:hypothetical protein